MYGQNLVGKKFGRLLVLSKRSDPIKKKIWVCRCDCGTEAFNQSAQLTAGKALSCGCLQRELQSARAFRHGAARPGKKWPEYSVWSAMIRRCYNQKVDAFPYYGGRGIQVCDAWRKSFVEFIAHVGKKPSPKHTLDRFPNKDGNYEPGNVRWATMKDQCKNRNHWGSLKNS